MKVRFDGEDYEITDQAIKVVFDHILSFADLQYSKLPDGVKIAAMAGVRALLAFGEKGEKDPEKKKLFRPAKGSDPTLHMVRLLLSGIMEHLPYAVYINTEGNIINGIGVQSTGESGGQVSSDGNVRIGEDHRSQDARQNSREAVSVP